MYLFLRTSCARTNIISRTCRGFINYLKKTLLSSKQSLVCEFNKAIKLAKINFILYHFPSGINVYMQVKWYLFCTCYSEMLPDRIFGVWYRLSCTDPLIFLKEADLAYMWLTLSIIVMRNFYSLKSLIIFRKRERG